MTHRIATPADGRAVPTWFVLGLIGIAALLAYIVLWRGVTRPGSFFGDDLIAYTSAADRLASTGSPYDPVLLAGPIDNRPENVPIGYFYPPVLAQLFLPLRTIPHLALALGWSAAQAICLLILLPLVAAGRSRPTLNTALLAIGFGLAFYPLQFSIFSGNVSGWLAIGVALSLVTASRVGGVVAAVATCIKLTPIPMFVAALTDRRSRPAAVIPLAIIVIVSVVLAPQAWSDFVKVLPNVLRNGMADSRTNLSPAHALFEFGLYGVGLAVGWALAIGFGFVAVVTGLREGYSNRVLAMAVLSVTFASSTLWDHYLGVMVPLILWAWPAAGSRQRLAFAVFVVLATGLWIRLDAVPEYRLALVVSLVVCSLAIAMTHVRVASPRTSWAYGT
jgi:Glycosyltransferase family 87